jgi:O-acetyl-ADP-ribose deacetylase (regulator of RNase III)
MLSMGGGVSAALHKAAGPTLEEEARRYVPVRAGRAVVTSAGALPARFVFHGVTMGARNQEWVLPSRDLISEVMESCFYHADTLGLQSLAFPLLGTGAGEFPPTFAWTRCSGLLYASSFMASRRSAWYASFSFPDSAEATRRHARMLCTTFP